MAKKDKPALTRERIVAAAVEIADEHGLESLSMRRLGQAVGVEAMSLYNHVADKDDLLDGIVDQVVSEIDAPQPGTPWRDGMEKRAVSARAMFARHPWAVGLMETRVHPGPATLAYYEAVIRCLREDGFSIAAAASAFSLIDSYVYGFALQQSKMPVQTSEQIQEVADNLLEGMDLKALPFFVELVSEHVMQPGYDYEREFQIGLDVVIEGAARLREQG